MNTNKELKHLEIKGAIMLLNDDIQSSLNHSPDNAIYAASEKRYVELLDAKRITDNAKYIIKLAENYKKIFP